MNIILDSSPFLVFVVLEQLIGIEPGLLGAVATSLLLLTWDVVIALRTPKALEIGTMPLAAVRFLISDYDGVFGFRNDSDTVRFLRAFRAAGMAER
ncbi:MAG: hypothetical protein WAV18_25740 [Roseiarcus sp.]